MNLVEVGDFGQWRIDWQPGETPSDVQPVIPETNVWHKVKPGDTLTALASAYGTSVQAIAALNPDLITDVNHIEVGWAAAAETGPTRRSGGYVAGGGQSSHAAQHLACGVSASFAAVMGAPHCSHQPKRPAPSRASAASISASASRSATARRKTALTRRRAAQRASGELLASAASRASW